MEHNISFQNQQLLFNIFRLQCLDFSGAHFWILAECRVFGGFGGLFPGSYDTFSKSYQLEIRQRVSYGTKNKTRNSGMTFYRDDIIMPESHHFHIPVGAI